MNPQDEEDNAYYSPENTSAGSYTTNAIAFIPSMPSSAGDGSAIAGGAGSAPHLPRAAQIIIGVIVGAVALDLLMNNGKLSIHKKLPEHMLSGGVGGAVGAAAG